MTGWLPRLWQQPSAVLLAVQLIGVLLYPFMDESPIGRAALSTFALVVLFLAVRAVQRHAGADVGRRAARRCRSSS